VESASPPQRDYFLDSGPEIPPMSQPTIESQWDRVVCIAADASVKPESIRQFHSGASTAENVPYLTEQAAQLLIGVRKRVAHALQKVLAFQGLGLTRCAELRR
jgi:hypothetical protein